MADHQGRPLDYRVGDPDVQAWLQARACMLVAQLYQDLDRQPQPGDELSRCDDQFAAEMLDYELSMMADGEHPLRIAFRIEMIRTSRDAQLLRGHIQQLPEYRPNAG
jgi:hypothetical protein